MRKKPNRPRMPKWFSINDAKFFRQYFSEEEFREFQKQKTGLVKESTEAGIPLEDIKHYWYKSKKYSIFAKNKEIDFLKLTNKIVSNIIEVAPTFEKYTRTKYSNPVLLCISPADIHFGKLAIKQETGNEYDLEIARAKEKADKGLFLSAQATVDIAKRDLRETEIRSPIDGILADRYVDLGTNVSAGQKVAI